MASLLATRGIENGALRSYALSALGHAAAAAAIFFLPAPEKRIFVEEIPRSVKLVASLETPSVPAPRPVRVPAPPKPKPAPQARPAPQRPAPPPPAPSKIQVPSRTAPPLLKPRERSPEPAPSSLREKLSSRLSDVAPPPAEAPPEAPPRIEATEIRSLTVPSLSVPSASLPPSDNLVPLSDFPYAWYISIVKEKVFADWRPPSTFSLGGRKAMAIASFRITREGGVSRIAIKEGSGHHLFDQSVLAALDGLAALPALPKDYKEEYLDVIIRFQSPNR